MGQYGNAIPGRLGTNDHHIIGEIDTSPAGNTILRCGATNAPDPGWSQRLHIVLSPEETRALIAELTAINEVPAPTLDAATDKAVNDLDIEDWAVRS